MAKKIGLIFGVIILLLGSVVFLNSSETFTQEGFYTKASNGLNVGSNIDFALPNQHEKVNKLSNETSKVIFVFEKGTSHVVKGYLSKQNGSFLESKNAMFVADISPMPTVIRNMFVMPDLKKSAYSVELMFDGKLATPFTNGADKSVITIVTLDNKKVVNVKKASTEAELINALN
ncbi:MAG: hypothetical protein IE878_01225 [Epsilonproteobacteria bacterium]|nr:hypothetical protein [Campylobacterota bacterium]MBD3838995.1 hypothetical protein [Campylobacterota bacterium]